MDSCEQSVINYIKWRECHIKQLKMTMSDENLDGNPEDNPDDNPDDNSDDNPIEAHGNPDEKINDNPGDKPNYKQNVKPDDNLSNIGPHQMITKIKQRWQPR
jgi:hypothetical protein